MLENNEIKIVNCKYGERKDIIDFLVNITSNEFGFTHWKDYYQRKLVEKYKKGNNNENAVVRRVEGKGIDGRKVTTHVVVSSKTRKGTRYIALWKNGNRKTFMLHKLYAEAFYMSENEACRRLYKGFIGYGQAVQNVKDILLKNLSDLEKEQSIGENRHDEILYIQQFLDELKNDKVCGVRQVENIK